MWYEQSRRHGCELNPERWKSNCSLRAFSPLKFRVWVVGRYVGWMRGILGLVLGMICVFGSVAFRVQQVPQFVCSHLFCLFNNLAHEMTQDGENRRKFG